jgi:N-acetylglucosamine kinase-like BadF-type ATPase
MSHTHEPAELAVDGRVVGIDVGATKTHLAVGSGGEVSFDKVVLTSTWRTRSAENNAAALARLVRGFLGPRALALPLGVGAHGCDTTHQCIAMAGELRRHFSGSVAVVNDAELMLLAEGISHGIGLVAGTGSIAAVRDDRNQLLTAGGWGWVLGDEGGAAGIVREAARAVLAQLDRGQSRDPLTKRLMHSCAVDEGPELAMKLTRSNSADAWGSHAREVFAAADEGSGAARVVIRDAGHELATLVQRLVERGVRAEQVVVGGAVILSQRLLWESFVESMEQVAPQIAVSRLDRAPVLGALTLASLSPEAVYSPDRTAR